MSRGDRFIRKPRAAHANSLTIRLGSVPDTSERSTPVQTRRWVEGAFAAVVVATARTHSSVRSNRKSKEPVSCTTTDASSVRRTSKSLGRNRTAGSSFLATLYALSLAAQSAQRSACGEAEPRRASRSLEVKTRTSNRR